jgi:hypothetical protein
MIVTRLSQLGKHLHFHIWRREVEPIYTGRLNINKLCFQQGWREK